MATCACKHEGHDHQPGKCSKPAVEGKALCHECNEKVGLHLATQANKHMAQK